MTQGNTDRQFRGINRTICIGLGGTGRDVLMRIRRLIVDRYGDLSNLSIVSFVHIDTDKTATQISGLRTGSTYHGIDLSFKDSEKISATMTSNEVTTFVQGLERRSSYDRQGPYEHITRWFPPQLLRNIKAVEEGAKGIRPVGRLAFFHNYKKIQDVIQKAENRTRGHDANLLKTGLRVDPGLNIFIIASLCGGTGSGMFLDVAYSLRKIYGDQGAQIVGYLVISPELYGNTPNMSANTYAALKELNHYTTAGTKFEAGYDVQDLIIVQEYRPPFDYTYLVSSQTKGEYKILEPRKLCNVIAHKIALDFSNELAPIVKGMRDNFLQHLIQWDNHPRPNPQRYLTFGLAAIYFPRDTIVSIALTRISLKLVQFWLNGEGQSPDPQLLLEQFLIQNRWHSDLQQRDGFTTRLAEAVEEGNKTFSSTINTWRNKLERQISETQNKDDRVSIRQQLPRELREQFRKTQPGETESSRGIWLTRLQQIAPKILEELKSHITEYMTALLTPGNPKFSIKNCRDFLDALRTEFDLYQRKLEGNITNFSGLRKLEDLDKKWRDYDQNLEDIENKFDVPLLGRKHREFQGEAKKILKQMSDLIRHNFDFAVTQEALKVVNELQKHLLNLSTQVGAFSRVVDILKGNYEKEEGELKQLNFDEMSGEAIFENDDLDRCYQALLPEQEFRTQLVLVSREMTQGTARGDSLAIFIRDRVSGEQLQTEIDLTVDRLFADRARNITVSVIERFVQNYSINERSTRLGQIMQEAEPLLRLSLNDPYFRDTPAKQSKLVGFKDTEKPEVQQFKTTLVRDTGIPETVFKPTQAADEILIVTEYAGFPLRLIQGLEQMRVPYSKEKHLEGGFLHNDYQTVFTDIIPPEASLMEQLEDVFYPCLAFELIQQNQENKTWEFKYHDELRDSYYTASLSTVWNQALEELANRRDMTEALKSWLEKAIQQMENRPNLWQGYYLPKLRNFVNFVDTLPESNPNYPYRSTVVGVPVTPENPGKEGIINRFRRQMEERFKIPQMPQPIGGSVKTSETANQNQIIDIEYVESEQKSSASSEDVMAKLKELVQMKKEGYLSDREFEAAKRKLLG
jgi:hypothetical protein